MMHTVMKLDSKKVITARFKRGLSQSQVAKKCRLSLMTISNAENEKELYPATAKTICDFLDLDLAGVMLPIEGEGNGDAA
jgi:transcriptional regulator with XRE-family HTH domain